MLRAQAAGAPITPFGHLLGVMAIELSGQRYKQRLTRIFALGVKLSWSLDKLARMYDLARDPPRVCGFSCLPFTVHAA